MSCKNGTKYMERKCLESQRNKLDKFIKDCQGGIVTLPERQFNCPSCIKSEKSPCQIPSWMKPPCDGVKCFNCPPKYLCLDASSCHFVNIDEKIKGKSN
ncbi:unnamed protein product [Rotaria sp. Silwood1]|nr:unnamed protein product [Rotaria sp. Silwood1]CAF3470370.1 unnamed protein product [Rotaria sp. Silwood1]CAF3494005.1 unnamed protein product [Rotaria sp. Silwood1]CAF3511950.1 unnamed protein product [Rotaria sp. Silwood1]